MSGYYSERLSAERLRKCYQIAPPRIRQYLEAETTHVADRIRPSDVVLELGCGYGRVVERLADGAGMVVGVDTSESSLRLAREYLAGKDNCRLLQMNAVAMGFCDQAFDMVACIQNGVSAFNVDQRALIGECIRVTRPGGRVLLSSYSERFWRDRLEWFQLQADHGLLGEIDPARTGNGVIVCKDGFTATTVSRNDLLSLTSGFHVRTHIEEVDESSLFCEIMV